MTTTADLANLACLALRGAGGIGKSHEISRLQQIESHLGHTTDLIELGKYASCTTALRTRLDEARERVGLDGSVYLDGLDEAIVPQSSPATVLEIWLDHLPDPLPRLRIGCRSAIWPGILTRALTIKYGEDAFLSCELQPLERGDVRAVAEAEGVDADRFVNSVQSIRAFVLATHPLTLKLLLEECRDSGLLPSTRKDLFERSVTRLLSESADRDERGTSQSFTLDLLVDAAERVALFATLAGRDSIDLNDGFASAASLHWTELELLPGCSGRELRKDVLRALARTRLFVADGDRRFRFFHRQFAEFLAGRRISQLPFRQARGLLSSDAGEEQGVAGPLRETSAVAGTFEPQLADWLARRDPEVVGLISDVADEDLRRNALFGFLNRFRVHELTDSHLSRDQISVEGFRYDGVENDLRPVLRERGEGLEDVHACAIELTESWGLSRLCLRTPFVRGSGVADSVG